MAEQWNRRIDERDEGRRRLSRLTGWTAAAGVALASVFGVAFARHDAAAAAPADQNQDQVTYDNGGVANLPDSGGGTVIQPPAQPPAPANRHGHVSSGGS